jgi:excisionase family DNA binding protein
VDGMSVNDAETTLPKMLSAAQVAEIYGVDSKTVSRWADEGRLGCIRTPGGHRRFFEAEILQGIKEAYAKTIPAKTDERFS